MSSKPKKMRVPAESPPQGREREARPARQKPKVPEAPAFHPIPSDFVAMQRAFGNAALQRMARQEQLSPRLPAGSGLKRPYGQIADWLTDQARKAGQKELLKRFQALSTGQKYAVLKSIAELYEAGDMQALSTEGWVADWEQIDICLKRVEPVPLEADEVEKEGEVKREGLNRENDDGNEPNVAGLLPPYRELVLWLNYKAHRQDKRDILREFDGLSLPQKRWALREMGKASAGSLRLKTFAEALTIQVDRKEWIDWEAVKQAVSKAGQQQAGQLEADEKREQSGIGNKALFAAANADDETQEEMGEREGGFALGGLLAAAAAMIGSREEEKQAEQIRKIKQGSNPFLEDPQSVIRLLLGEKGVANHPVQAIRAFLSAPGNKAELVDRFLELPKGLSAKQLEFARKELMQKAGLQSLDQAFAHIMKQLGQLVFQKGVLQEEREFIGLIEELGLTRVPGKLPNVQMIAQKLSRI